MSHTSYQSDPDVWLEDHPAASFWQWLITRAVTEQTLSLTILRLKLYLFSYFDLWWFNHKYGGTWVPPNHRSHVVFGSMVNHPAAMGSQHLSNHVINSAGTFDSDQLGDFLRHFFRVKHEELMCLSVRFFGRCFFREIYGTREVEKNANCVEARDIKNIKSKWVALQKSLRANHLPHRDLVWPKIHQSSPTLRTLHPGCPVLWEIWIWCWWLLCPLHGFTSSWPLRRRLDILDWRRHWMIWGT